MKMNRYRLARRINDIRNDACDRLNNALGSFGYTIKLNANGYHMADRIIDRANNDNHAELLNTVSDMLASLGDHYACNLLYFAKKNTGSFTQLIVKRVVDGQTTAIAFNLITDGDIISLHMRTVITEYTMTKYDAITVDFVAPKIVFEYNGYRRQLSRLISMVESDLCPEPLKVLRFR